MDTLYDLLGALPRDDAEELRAAFRRAVKGAHPDLHPGDPDAGQKFREIVRANDILSDGEQRAAYDHLLDLARREQSGKARAFTVRKSVLGAMAVVTAVALGVAWQLLDVSRAWLSPAEIMIARPGDFAGMAPLPALVTKEAKADSAPLDKKLVQTIAIEPTPIIKALTPEMQASTTPAAAALPVDEPDRAVAAPLGPPLDIMPADARVFHERGVFAYRSGDLDGAVAEFDRAIRVDPKFSAAYADRGLALYQMQRFERAYADIAQARRIEKASRPKTAPPAAAAARKPPTTVALGLTPFLQRRAARLE